MKHAARSRAASFPPTRVLALSALSLVLAMGGALLGCTSSDDAASLVESTFDVHLTTGTAMRGVSMTLRHAADFELLTLADGDEPIASGSCTQNVTPGQIRATCATSTSFSAPIDAWRVTMRHPSDRDLDVGILELSCEGSDVAGNTFAIGCQVVP